MEIQLWGLGSGNDPEVEFQEIESHFFRRSKVQSPDPSQLWQTFRKLVKFCERAFFVKKKKEL
jgi:hypothetical protein